MRTPEQRAANRNGALMVRYGAILPRLMHPTQAIRLISARKATRKEMKFYA